MKLCHCGSIVKERCERCYPQQPHKRTTKERGYDNRWRELSKAKRAADPLCERCSEAGRAEPATEVHHIEPIDKRPDLRLEWSNLMSVCRACHDAIEGKDRW